MANKPTAPVIVVTGGTGCGKSTATDVFRKLGARVVNVDTFAHRLLKPGGEPWQEILREFCGAKWKRHNPPGPPFAPGDFLDAAGQPFPELPWVIQADGAIRRDKLAATVFSNAQLLEALNKIMHARLRKLLDVRVKLHRKISARPLVLDMAVYPAKAFRRLGDVVLWVRSPGGLRAQRLVENKHLTGDEAGARVRMQWKDEEYRKLADFILPNLGSISDLKQAAAVLWPKLLSRASSRGK